MLQIDEWIFIIIFRQFDVFFQHLPFESFKLTNQFLRIFPVNLTCYFFLYSKDKKWGTKLKKKIGKKWGTKFKKLKFSVNFTWFFINTSNWRINFCLIFSVNLTLFYTLYLMNVSNWRIFQVLPTVSARVTFHDFHWKNQEEKLSDELFSIPEGYVSGVAGLFLEMKNYMDSKKWFFAKYRFWLFFPSIWRGFAKFCLKMLFAWFFPTIFKAWHECFKLTNFLTIFT